MLTEENKKELFNPNNFPDVDQTTRVILANAIELEIDTWVSQGETTKKQMREQLQNLLNTYPGSISSRNSRLESDKYDIDDEYFIKKQLPRAMFIGSLPLSYLTHQIFTADYPHYPNGDPGVLIKMLMTYCCFQMCTMTSAVLVMLFDIVYPPKERKEETLSVTEAALKYGHFDRETHRKEIPGIVFSRKVVKLMVDALAREKNLGYLSQFTRFFNRSSHRENESIDSISVRNRH